MRIRAKEWRRSSFEQRRRFIYRFSHHPTVLGLFFSILGQFTGTGYGTDTDGNFIKLLFPENALVGKNVPEKIAIGTFSWLFHLVSDIDGSNLESSL